MKLPLAVCLIALVCALPGSAQDDDGGENPPEHAVNPVSAGGGANHGANHGAMIKSGQTSGAPKSGGLRWRVYERLGAMPRPAGYSASHGYADLQPGEGISVGFKTAPSGGNGRCGIVPSPAVSAGPAGCTWNAWISAKPGGSPLAGKCSGSGTFVMGLTVEWASTPHPYGNAFCDVKPGGSYYCNVTGCRGLIHSPLGVEDYSRAEGQALAVGKSCTMPGTTAVGVIAADGTCQCQDDLCKEMVRKYDSLPRCTNQVMRHANGTCYSCASMYPAGCGGSNQVVDNCGLACKP